MKFNIFKITCTIIVLHFCHLSSINARQHIQNQYKFRFLTVDDGLSYNRISSICEDKNGYIWAATMAGLNKITGTKIINYYHKQQDTLSLPSDMINVVFADSRNNIWIGSLDGICRYHEGLDGFIRFSKGVFSKPFEVWNIDEDEFNNIWFATAEGAIKYNTQEDSLFVYNTENIALQSNEIFKVFCDTNHQIWLSTVFDGACLLNDETKQIKLFNYDPNDNNSISGNRVTNIYKDVNNNIWLSTFNNGINKFNAKKGTFKRYTIDSTNTYSSRVRCIFEIPNHQFFIGTRAGLYCLDETTDSFYLYANTDHDFSRINSNSTLCSFIDHTSGLWLGTYYGGVSYTNLDNKPFTSYTAKKNNTFFLNNSSIFGISEDSLNNIYICTEEGVNILNKETSKFSYIHNDPNNSNSLSYNDVKDIVTYPNGDFWAGTNKGGLTFYSKQNNQYTIYKNIPGDSTSLPYNKVYDIHLDKDENLWVLSNPDGYTKISILSFLPKGKTKFRNYYNEFFQGIIEDGQNNMFIGGRHAFWKFNKETEKFTHFSKDSLIGQRVYCLFLDKLGDIWIGSNEGITRYNFKSKRFTDYTKKFIHPAKNTYGIIADTSDNLWISTNSGLFKFINAIHAPIDSLEIRMYNKDDGLPSKEFMYNSFHYNKKNNEMFFGGANGFIRFSPEKIIDNAFEPQICLSNLIINGKIIKQYDTIKGLQPLLTSLNKTDKITLNHQIKSFTLQFDALHFSNPTKNGFKYRLDNYDQNWQMANCYNNTVTYSNLKPGNYTFRIYASNSDGILCSTPKELEIEILPPYWDELWFKLTIIISILLVFLFIFRNRINIYRKREQLLQDAVDKRTVELQIQKKEIEFQSEKLKEQNTKLIQLDQFKEALTGTIVHDLKNPLNSIINPPTLLSLKDQIIQTQHAGKQMLNLVLNILDVHKYEHTQMQINKSSISLFTIAENAIIDTTYLCQQKNIKIKNHIIKSYFVFADGEILSRVFINLFTNAIKYSEMNGIINVDCEELLPTEESSLQLKVLKILVKDYGMGIPLEKTASIFEKFEQLDSKKSGQIRSTGLGLTFCKMAIHAHDGEIGVASKIGEGSTFWFTIQKADNESIIEPSTMDNSGIDNTHSSFNFSDSEIKILKPIVLKLKEFEVYELSSIKETLNQINQIENENIKNWLYELNKSLFLMNNEKYKDLLNI